MIYISDAGFEILRSALVAERTDVYVCVTNTEI